MCHYVICRPGVLAHTPPRGDMPPPVHLFYSVSLLFSRISVAFLMCYACRLSAAFVTISTYSSPPGALRARPLPLCLTPPPPERSPHRPPQPAGARRSRREAPSSSPPNQHVRPHCIPASFFSLIRVSVRFAFAGHRLRHIVVPPEPWKSPSLVLSYPRYPKHITTPYYRTTAATVALPPSLVPLSPPTVLCIAPLCTYVSA